jgi:uncharacterized protein
VRWGWFKAQNRRLSQQAHAPSKPIDAAAPVDILAQAHDRSPPIARLIHISASIDDAHLCVYRKSMAVEWDEGKRSWTLLERGLDFADVATVDWDKAFTVEDARKAYPEARFITLAPIHGRLCVFAWCWREDRQRVISLRKANERERIKYAKALQQP